MFSTQFFTLNYLIMWRDHFKEFLKMRFQVLTLCQSEQRTWFCVICVYQKEDLYWWCKHGNMNNTRINSWNKSTHWHSWTVNISHVLLLIFLNKSNFRNLFGFCNFLNFPLTLEFNFLTFVGKAQGKTGITWKSKRLLWQSSKHNKSSIWTQSQECTSKNDAKIRKTH